MCCSFRHGLRRDTFLKEEGFGAFYQQNKSTGSGKFPKLVLDFRAKQGFSDTYCFSYIYMV